MIGYESVNLPFHVKVTCSRSIFRFKEWLGGGFCLIFCDVNDVCQLRLSVSVFTKNMCEQKERGHFLKI